MKEGRFRLVISKKFFPMRDEALTQVAQRRSVCPIPGSIQGQVGWGFEQPVQGLRAHGREFDLDDLTAPSKPNHSIIF